MDRRGHRRGEVRLDQRAAAPSDAKRSAEERLGGGRAEQHEHPGLDHGDLCLEPRAAGGDLARARLLMNAPLPARLPLEVLHGIRHVRSGAVDPGLGERLVEESPRRADERPSRPVLLVTRLLADEHGSRVLRALAEDGLGSEPPELAPPAAGCGLAKGGQRTLLGEEIGRGSGFLALVPQPRYDRSQAGGTPRPGDSSAWQRGDAWCRFAKRGLTCGCTTNPTRPDERPRAPTPPRW